MNLRLELKRWLFAYPQWVFKRIRKGLRLLAGAVNVG
jgi:hypothetical protein